MEKQHKPYSPLTNLGNGAYIEPEISSKLYNRNYSYLRCIHESNNIYEIIVFNKAPKTLRDKVYNQLTEHYSKYSTLGSNWYMSNWVHFHIWITEDDYRILTDNYNNGDTNNENRHLKQLLLSTPLWAKPVIENNLIHLVNRDLWGNSDWNKWIYRWTCRLALHWNRRSMEFRLNQVINKALIWYYIFIIHSVINKINPDSHTKVCDIQLETPESLCGKTYSNFANSNEYSYRDTDELGELSNSQLTGTTLSINKADTVVLFRNIDKICSYLVSIWNKRHAQMLSEYVYSTYKLDEPTTDTEPILEVNAATWAGTVNEAVQTNIETPTKTSVEVRSTINEPAFDTSCPF